MKIDALIEALADSVTVLGSVWVEERGGVWGVEVDGAPADEMEDGDEVEVTIRKSTGVRT
jgi:hypothetical protein